MQISQETKEAERNVPYDSISFFRGVERVVKERSFLFVKAAREEAEEEEEEEVRRRERERRERDCLLDLDWEARRCNMISSSVKYYAGKGV